MAARKGTSTPEYELFRKNLADLSTGITPNVIEIAIQALAQNLISDNNLSEAKNPTKTPYDRASGLNQLFLSRIELDAEDFYTILGIFQSIPALKTVCKILQIGQASGASNGASNGAHGGPSASSAKKTAVSAPPSKLDQRPSSKEAFKALLSIQDKWKPIGTLLEVPDGKLNGIENRTTTDMNALLEMINEWLKIPGATWRGLIEAVRSIDEQKAIEIEKSL